jgi:hypothetical protein
MVNVFFMHRIKRTDGVYDKGIEVKNMDRREGESDEALSRRNYEAALQAYHAYMGAYAYEHDSTTDFVCCEITDTSGARLLSETWKASEPEPEPEPET